MKKIISGLLASAGLAIAAPVWAADDNADTYGGIGEIVVTAQKRAENIQATPIAITAYTEDSLTALGISSVADVASVTPSLYSAPYPNSPTTIQLYMRGQGVNNPLQLTKDGAVGIYLDGFYLARPQSATMDMADIERVEVLRGPQGTLYGRNTTGGAVNIITRKPTGEADLRQTLTIGNRDYIRSLTNIEAPAMGPLSIKGTLLYSKIDGWVNNSGGEDFGYRQQTAGQVSARLQASETFTVDYSFDKGRVNSTPMFFVSDDLVDFVPDYFVDRKQAHRGSPLKKSRMDFTGHSLTLNWEVSDNLTLRSLSGYRHVDADMVQYYVDAFSSPSAGSIYNIRPYDEFETKQYSQEIQAIGEFSDRFKYVAGLYYFREKGAHSQETITELSLPSGRATGTSRTFRHVDMLAQSKAAYAQFTYTPDMLDDRLDLTIGVRYTEDERDANRDLTATFTPPSGVGFPTRPVEVNVPNNQKFEKFNPSATVNFRASNNLTLFAKYASGYRAGGSDEAALYFTEGFEPETVSNFELGVKSDWFERRLRLNLAAFHMDYKNIQMDLQLRRNDPSINQTINAGRAYVRGIEADLTVAPIENLMITASYAFLDNKVKEVTARAGTILDPAVNPDSGFQIGQNVARNFTLAYAPRHAYSIAADYDFLKTNDVTFKAHANYQWKDQAFASSPAGPAIRGRQYWAIPSFGTLDLRLSATWDTASGSKASLALWGRNVTDKAYKATVAASGAAATGYVGQVYTYGEPATYGIELSYKY